MKYLLLSLSLFFSSQLFAQTFSEHEKPDSNYIDYWCSTAILLETEKNLGKLDIVLVANFLATFHESCKNNVEYSEWSNELLFLVISKKPDRVLELLSKNSSLSRDYILNELANPTHEQRDLDKIIESIREQKVPDSDEWKLKIIKSLEAAKEK